VTVLSARASSARCLVRATIVSPARLSTCHITGPRIVLQVMKHTPPTSTTATPRDDARTPQPPHSTLGEMLEELIDLSAGIGVALMPLLLLAVPGIILFVVLPAILLLALAAPLAAIGAVIAVPPYLVARLVRRRRRRPAKPPAGHAESALRSVRTSGQSRVPDLGTG
jgi:Flp pilus assembly protein TadB